MKIYICSKFKKGPWGGGNQFLKALRSEFKNNNLYTEDVQDADIILFNSHHLSSEIINLKNKYSHKIFVHRIDGPMALYNYSKDRRDAIVYKMNRYISDGTIFQSQWSKEENIKLGLKCTKFNSVIPNAPDLSLFYQTNKQKKISDKIKLISTSWSTNPNKGFEMLKFIDDNLDWTRFSMTFIGNSPISFNNIKYKKALPSNLLGKELQNNDIFITASQKDPCSNSLIEALHCGLPAVALNDGGHPEIIIKGGELFYGERDIIQCIDKVSKNIDLYRNNINVPDIKNIVQRYIIFFTDVLESALKGNYDIKRINYFDKLKLKINIILSIKN